MENPVNPPVEPTLEPGNTPEDLLPETAPEIVPTPEPQPQIPAIAVIVLIVFILLAFGTVVFFYLQNQQLKKMLVNYQTQNITPTPTPTEEITPTASPSAMTDWKTYTNKISHYSLKYSPTWKIVENKQLLGAGEISDTKWNLLTTNDIPNVKIVVYKSDSDFVKSLIPGKIQTTIDGEVATKSTNEGTSFTTNYSVTNTTNTYLITLETTTKQELTQYESVLNQVLATFKFTSTTSLTPTPTLTQ